MENDNLAVGAREAGTDTANTVTKVCGGFNTMQDTLSIHFLRERQALSGGMWEMLGCSGHNTQQYDR